LCRAALHNAALPAGYSIPNIIAVGRVTATQLAIIATNFLPGFLLTAQFNLANRIS
jgi:hypothetical protein